MAKTSAIISSATIISLVERAKHLELIRREELVGTQASMERGFANHKLTQRGGGTDMIDSGVKGTTAWFLYADRIDTFDGKEWRTHKDVKDVRSLTLH